MPILRFSATLAAAAAILAGCATEPAAPEPSPTPAPAPHGHGGLAACLAEHGVPAAPGPAAGPPPGVDTDTWQRAMQACAELAPGPSG